MKAKIVFLLLLTTVLFGSCNSKKYWYGSTKRDGDNLHIFTECYISKKWEADDKENEQTLNSIADKNFSQMLEGKRGITSNHHMAFVTLGNYNEEYYIALAWFDALGYGNVSVRKHVTSGKGWSLIYKTEDIYNFNSALKEYERQRDSYVRMLEKE